MTSNPSPINVQAPNHTSTEWVGDTADDWDPRSITKTYHRMEASKAAEYIDNLRMEAMRAPTSDNPRKTDPKAALEKLEEDERRILDCRARLSKNPRTKKLQDELEALFQKWWNETEGRSPKMKKITHSWAEREALVKPDICSASVNDARGVGDNDDPAHDVNAYFMFFKKHGDEWKGENYRGKKFSEYEKFPNQRMSVHEALHDDTHNPFKPICDENGISYLRYIHIPANHMGWIEQAMARYHDEHKKHASRRVKTSHTLSREFWKGQLHGNGLGRTPIHATHMRPRCSVIPGETQSLFGQQRQPSMTTEPHGSVQEETKAPHKDLAIFMPYLHWETSSRRARMTRTVQEALSKERKKGQLKRRTTRPVIKELELDSYAETWQNSKKEKTGKRTALAKYLLKLAQVWQDMDMELDERLVRHGLLSRDTKAKSTEPLLHIRRTLDQSYFLNLKDTSQRDKDQVVYRATKWQGNLARVVMVDQLWLWILDEHTIITSFPKRWGRNKPDPSGIHKSLRERLGRHDCKIMSGWHLACIIIDQCSNVFFDRTKPLDLRPEVMDIFAETLGDVNHHTTIAFKAFWRNVERFTKSRDRRGSHRQSQKYLDINPEGTLLREAQDIAEELRIMIGIYSQQLGVVKSFQKCLEQMNGDPKTRHKAHHPVKSLQQMFDWTREHTVSLQAPNKKKPVSLAEMDFLEDLVEEVEDRKSEIMDLESAALQTCQQLQELLSLKQQQASIVEAKAALDRADQSVEQGKAIMAFTIMTIIFTPLGFFTSFFGMNNSLTGADWMTLGHQCLYMMCLSAIIIVIALSLAFKGSKIRRILKPLRGPKARWQDSKTGWRSFKTRWHGKRSNPDEKEAEMKDEGQQGAIDGAKIVEEADKGQSSGTDSARAYFHLPCLSSVRLNRLASRNNRSQNDVENSIPEQDEIVRTKTKD